MSNLKPHFHPSQEEIWTQISQELGGSYSDTLFKKKIELKHGDWILTLDSYAESAMSGVTVSYTRLRAPYLNRDGFRFKIYPESLFSQIGKTFGMQDVRIGVPEFDEKFIIKGSDEQKLQQLFANPKIRELILSQPDIHLEVKPDEGWFGVSFPEGVDELYFETVGIVRDPERLKQLFDLFSEVLNHLCQIGSAYENDPGMVL
ncbi:MAG: DUF3137 domain-containing protein [Calditrichaeota bacterium]|nr:DUF3137 domain-containing protein [Calditrichota bacterium]